MYLRLVFYSTENAYALPGRERLQRMYPFHPIFPLQGNLRRFSTASRPLAYQCCHGTTVLNVKVSHQLAAMTKHVKLSWEDANNTLVHSFIASRN